MMEFMELSLSTDLYKKTMFLVDGNQKKYFE